MNCHGCGYFIDDRTWNYCKKCGTSTAQIELPQLEVIPISGNPEGQAVSIPLVINNNGMRPGQFKVTMLSDEPWAKLDTLPMPPSLGAQSSYTFNILANPPASLDGEKTLRLEVETNDGIKDPNDTSSLWKRERKRKRSIDVTLLIQQPQPLVVSSNIVTFSHSLLEREVKLFNSGATPIVINNIKEPQGLTILIEQANAWVPLRNHLANWSVPAAEAKGSGEAVIKIRMEPELCDWMKESRQNPIQILTFFDSRNQATHLSAYVFMEGGNIDKAPYIVSIDFGTDHIAVIGRNPSQPNSIEPIPIFDSNSEDFYQAPAYIAYHKNGNEKPLIGKKALNIARDPFGNLEYEVFSDVKLWLRNTDLNKQARYNNALRDFLRALRGQINTFIEEKPEFGHQVPDSVRYVVTLPVLDNDGEHAREQRRRMEEALAMVYGLEISEYRLSMNDFSFPQEPQAAAACFLLGQAYLASTVENYIPRNFQKNDLIVVIDSGAGTTDVALVLVTDKSDDDKFHILDTFGTAMGTERSLSNQELREFGGRMLDRKVYDIAIQNYLTSKSTVINNDSIEIATDSLYSLIAKIEGTELNAETRIKFEKLVLGWAENAKKTLDNKESTSFAVQGPTAQEYEDLQLYAVTQQELEKVLSGPIKDIVVCLSKRLDAPRLAAQIQQLPPQNRSIRHVIAIGGTAITPAMEKCLRNEIPNGNEVVVSFDQLPINVSKRLRKQAVVQGGAWMYEAPIGNLMPFALFRNDGPPGSAQKRPLIDEHKPIIGKWERSLAVNKPSFGDYIFELAIKIEDKDFYLCREVIKEPGKHFVDASIDEDWNLKATLRLSSGNARVICDYRIK